MEAGTGSTSSTSSTACGTNTITVQAAQASAPNATCVSTPHIVQYPKMPVRDDGKWMAIGTMIGGLIGKFANQDKLDSASGAEDTWRDLNDRLKEQGLYEWARTPQQRAIAADADNLTHNSAIKNWTYEYDEKAYADKLKACDDALHERLCTLAQCGYSPDYSGILSRVRADAATVTAAQRAAYRRDVKRYNACKTSAMCIDMVNAEITATVSAAAMAREQERQAAWKYNWDTTVQATQVIEQDRVNRAKLASDYDRLATTIEQGRYTAHIADADNSLKLGADMLASAGQNYAWLAESLRRSAEKDTGNFAALGGLIIPLLMTIFGNTCAFSSKDCSCA